MSEVTHTFADTRKSYISKVEDAIVAALKVGVEGSVKVDSFPAGPASYDFAGLDAAALVHYSGSNFAKRDGDVSPNQTRRMNYSIVLLTRSLRADAGAYRALEDIRLALQGKSFEGAGPVELVSDGLVREDQGQWRWEIVIGLSAPAVARVGQTSPEHYRPVTQRPPIAGREYT